jgi:putative Mg2+ transporter-C (MgtC) family protein
MYYENKRSFYIKQYGPAAAVVVIALALIVTGVVIGFRSISLILLGSFMYTHISTLIGGDPARIIAQIVTGVGFIGAGMIFKHDSRSIFNLTTAILVWTLSAVGVLLGLNYRLEAIVTALIIFFILSFKKQS